MVALVALRLGIGWHFFKEGLSHRYDQNWSSEGFLKQAKGPLADKYQSVLPRFHDWDRLIMSQLVDNGPVAEDVEEPAAAPKDKAADKNAKSDKPAKPTVYSEWLDQVKKDWKTEQDSFAVFYGLSEHDAGHARRRRHSLYQSPGGRRAEESGRRSRLGRHVIRDRLPAAGLASRC
jgi:hypothetical protein